MARYSITFVSESFCDWIIEAESKKDVIKMIHDRDGGVDEIGTFIEERFESYYPLTDTIELIEK